MINIFDRKTSYKEALISNGIYDLTKIMISAETMEDIYGNYELNMEIELQGDVPIGLYDMVQVDNIIKVNDEGSEELFRIAQVNKGLDFIGVYCRHITISDSLNLWLDNVRPTNATGTEAILHIARNTTPKCELLLNSNISKISTADYVRRNLYEALFEGENAFVNRWGGEVKRTGYELRIVDKLGQDKSDKIIIKEALNLTEFNAKSNIDEVSTVIYPIGHDGITTNRVESPLINNYSMEFPIEIKYEDVKVKKKPEEGQTPSEQDQEGFDTLAEAQAELTRRAKAEFTDNHLDKIKFECDIDYIDLEKYEEYKDITALQTAFLGDVIAVRVDTFDMDIKARVVARKYDVLRNKRLENTISTEGTLKKPESIKDIIKDILENEPPEIFEGLGPYIDGMIQQGFKNGYIVYEKNAVYAVDKLPKEKARNVVVLNKNGLGYSSTGIQGPYTYGFTIDGKLNASMITTGTLHGQYIGAGTIEANKLTVNAKQELRDGLATTNKVTQLEANIDGVNLKVAEVDKKTNSNTTKITKLEATANGIKTEVGALEEKVDNWRVGGYNYLINSDIALTNTMLEHMNRPSFKGVENTEELQGQKIALSVDVEAEGVVWKNYNGAKRAGWELVVTYTDGTKEYLGCWYNNNDPTTYKGRLCKTYTLKNKPILHFDDQRDLYIQGWQDGSLRVSRPKLEIGSTCTDWSPNKLDTDGPLGETIEKVSKIEQTNSQIATKVQENTNKIGVVDGKFVNYVTNSKFTEFKQNTEQFEFNIQQSGSRNLVLNSHVEHGGSYWGAEGNARFETWESGASGTISKPKTWGGIRSSLFEVTPNQKLYVSCRIGSELVPSSANGARGIRTVLNISFFDSNGKKIQDTNIRDESSTVKWTEFIKDIVVPANASKARVILTGYADNFGSGTGLKVLLDWVRVSQEKSYGWAPHEKEVYSGITTINKDGIRCDFEDGTYAQMGRDGFKYKRHDWSHPYQYITKIVKLSKIQNGKWQRIYLGEEFKGKRINEDFKITEYIGAVDCNAFTEKYFEGALRTSFAEWSDWRSHEASLLVRCCIQKIGLVTHKFYGWDSASTSPGAVIGESAGDIIVIAQM